MFLPTQRLTNMNTRKSRWTVTQFRGISQWLLMVCLVAVMAAGCSKNTVAAEERTASEDPAVQATLNHLTHELRRTMVGNKLSGNFDEFVALRHLDVPPPPAGKKYAINNKWKVVLVNAQ
jgi:hypothetical protein